ncbi:hypothetical protein ACFSTI_00775 [Rhizorhabdus histidinilytica]
MSMVDIDVWVGKTLFVPPIIKLCQLTRQSQYAISRLFWFITALDQLRIATSLTSQIIAGLFSLFMMVTASLRADIPAFSMRWFRIVALVFLLLDVFSGVVSGQWKGSRSGCWCCSLNMQRRSPISRRANGNAIPGCAAERSAALTAFQEHDRCLVLSCPSPSFSPQCPPCRRSPRRRRSRGQGPSPTSHSRRRRSRASTAPGR